MKKKLLLMLCEGCVWLLFIAIAIHSVYPVIEKAFREGARTNSFSLIVVGGTVVVLIAYFRKIAKSIVDIARRPQEDEETTT